MSERGVFAVDRGIWDHPIFADEPLTEREAWQWLIGEACWKPQRRRVGSIAVDLIRGQLAHSLRFMADKWKWSEARVRRFLNRLKIDAMIDAQADAGVTVITVCNYDKYQRVSLPSDAPTDATSDAAATQQRRKEEDIKGKEEVAAAAPARAAEGGIGISKEAWMLAGQLAAVSGHPMPPADWPPDWAGAPMRIQGWLNSGWQPLVILIAARAAAGKKPPKSIKRVDYFEGAIADEHARQAKPIPKTEVSSVQANQTAGRSGGGKGGGFATFARDRAKSSG